MPQSERYATLTRLVMIRNWWPMFESRPMVVGQIFAQTVCLAKVFLCLVMAAITPTLVWAQDAAPPPAPDQKIVTNPFVPGGVGSAKQIITRDEVMALMAEQEARLRQELTSNVNSEEINKLIISATGGGASLNPESFIGCVNGVPLYRDDDGGLNLGIDEPEELKMERCKK